MREETSSIQGAPMKFGKLALLLAALLALYTLLLLAAYSFPDAWIEKNVNAATAILKEESNMPGGYATYFWHSGQGIADNVTDRTMYYGLLRNGRSAVDAAMHTEYAWYWHGYSVLLRPLSIALSIINLRYVNMLALMTLFLLCYWHARVRLGIKAALVFSSGILMSFFLLAPFCLQYCDVYYLTLLGCLAALRRWELLRNWLDALFLALGSLVCFFDFLTFPVLALGYPLLCCLLMLIREGAGAKRLWGATLRLSALWMAGYALTWLAKAGVGALLCGQNVAANMLAKVAERTTGVFDTGERLIEITPWEAIRINLESFFTGANTAFFALLLLFCAVAVPRRGVRKVALDAAACNAAASAARDAVPPDVACHAARDAVPHAAACHAARDAVPHAAACNAARDAVPPDVACNAAPATVPTVTPPVASPRGVARAPAASSRWLCALPLLFVALYPLIWYCVLQNHSRVHFWMTWRSLAISVYGICGYVLATRSTRR